jgi:hypothetical protein
MPPSPANVTTPGSAIVNATGHVCRSLTRRYLAIELTGLKQRSEHVGAFATTMSMQLGGGWLECVFVGLRAFSDLASQMELEMELDPL